MHRSANHPDQHHLAQGPPEPSGHPLATFSRPGGRFGPATELRCSLEEYEGHPFINLRVWTQGPDRGWYPTRKGVSIKLREARNLAAALIEAADLADAEQGEAPLERPQARRPGPASRRERPGGRGQGSIPRAGTVQAEASSWDRDFDEFPS